MILHEEFIRIAKKNGKKLAIIDRGRESKVTYGKSLIASLMLAEKFKVYKQGFVGVMIPTSAGAMLTTMGLMMSGRVPVMINYSTGAAENCEYAQQKCGFKTIITSRALLEKIGSRIVPGMVFIEDVMTTITAVDKIKAALKSKMPFNVIKKSLPKAHEEDNVVILFTSGSEKDPKAVQLTHKNIGANVIDIFKSLKLDDSDIFLGNLPLFHVFGYNTNFWLPLLRGLTVVTYPNPLEYRKIVQIIKEENISLMLGTPVFFHGYLRQSEPGELSSVRIAVAGADKCPDILRDGYKKKHGITLLEGYGCTETSPVISVNLPNANKPGSTGKPLPSVKVKIADINTGEELPRGAEGKLLTKGDHIMKGYFDDLEETSLRIKDGWYDTGDMGMMDEDGYVWHRGRLKRFTKIGGEMVSLVKIESVMTELLPPEADCCVVEIPDYLKGAMIIAAVTVELDKKEIVKKMSEQLPNIALPRHFLVMDELPKMGSGKVDFRGVTEIVKEKFADNNNGDNEKTN